MIKKLIEPGVFIQVYLLEDLHYQKDCLLTAFIFKNVEQTNNVEKELQEQFNPVEQEELKNITVSKKFLSNGEQLFVIQKTSEENYPKNLQRYLLPLNESEIVELLNQVLLTLDNNQDTSLPEDLHKLALTSLILLNGKNLYNCESKSWNW